MLSHFKNAVIGAVSGLEINGSHSSDQPPTKSPLPPKFPYNRPHFLNFGNEEVQMSADHRMRPVIHPNKPLPHFAGYAECVNAGKSKWNEDQAVFRLGVLTNIRRNDGRSPQGSSSIPYAYYGIFDGHAGVGAALCAANQLHHILHEKLVDAQDDIWIDFIEQTSSPPKTTDLLITGALEAAFRDMDQLIAEDRNKYQGAGGCTALVALIILGKLFVANAGDSRAIICDELKCIPMSMDFTPENERVRIRNVAEAFPSLLGTEFTFREYLQQPRSNDLGKTIMYRDAHMKGWAYKTLQIEDLKIPVITGQGKRSRVMGTIGVTRGFGDHDLLAVYQKIPIKPFLSCHPEVQIYPLTDVTSNTVLIMATDGLWDVICHAKAAEIVIKALSTFKEKERYVSAATCLVGTARGYLVKEHSWLLKTEKPASVDDISTFVIPLLPFKKDFDEFLVKNGMNKSCKGNVE